MADILHKCREQLANKDIYIVYDEHLFDSIGTTKVSETTPPSFSGIVFAIPLMQKSPLKYLTWKERRKKQKTKVIQTITIRLGRPSWIPEWRSACTGANNHLRKWPKSLAEPTAKACVSGSQSVSPDSLIAKSTLLAKLKAEGEASTNTDPTGISHQEATKSTGLDFGRFCLCPRPKL